MVGSDQWFWSTVLQWTITSLETGPGWRAGVGGGSPGPGAGWKRSAGGRPGSPAPPPWPGRQAGIVKVPGTLKVTTHYAASF